MSVMLLSSTKVLSIPLVTCPSLSDPSNGMISCSLGDDNVTSYEDTCNFTCDNGYQLTGSNTRICQSDGSWSGNNSMCTKRKFGSWQLKLVSKQKLMCCYVIFVVNLHNMCNVVSKLTLFS